MRPQWLGEFLWMLGWFVFWVALTLVLFLVLDKKVFGILVGTIGAIAGLSGFVLIAEREKGGRVTLGRPEKFVTHENGFFRTGLHWVLWPVQKILKFPTSQQQMDFRAENVITAPGKFKISGTKDEEELGAATISVDATAYFLWPDGDGLLIAIREAGATSTEGLRAFVQNAMLDVIRKIAGAKTWRELVIDREQFERDIEGVISRLDNPMARANIILGKEVEVERKGQKVKKWEVVDRTRFSLAVVDVKLPETLDKAILEPEVRRLEGEGVRRKAIGEAEAIRLKGAKEAEVIRLKGTAEGDARRAMLTVVKEFGADFEALDVLRDMAQGPATTIFYNIPDRLYDAMSRTLGGVRPEDVFKMLSPEAQKDIQQLITDKLKQISQPKGGTT